jgi:hypothetical protein
MKREAADINDTYRQQRMRGRKREGRGESED